MDTAEGDPVDEQWRRNAGGGSCGPLSFLRQNPAGCGLKKRKRPQELRWPSWRSRSGCAPRPEWLLVGVGRLAAPFQPLRPCASAGVPPRLPNPSSAGAPPHRTNSSQPKRSWVWKLPLRTGYLTAFARQPNPPREESAIRPEWYTRGDLVRRPRVQCRFERILGSTPYCDLKPGRACIGKTL